MGSTELEDQVIVAAGGAGGVGGGGVKLSPPPPPPQDKRVTQDARTSKRLPKNTVADTPEADAMVLRFGCKVIVRLGDKRSLPFTLGHPTLSSTRDLENSCRLVRLHLDYLVVFEFHGDVGVPENRFVAEDDGL